ncbi:phospholipase A2 inhibitor gamma subunit B [Bombina bombina]|uniref:phospholipase A2 inhibitor gamma subunit B n=1 Tax=Bombina bombina TaxID=8345 RepID=UPI00235ACA11|nr:phospholipase A2 inhibitor gamma subunit B [Bombina bombina]
MKSVVIMRNFLSLTFILLALTPSGNCLSCIHCVTLDGSPCNGPSVVCAAGEVCLSVITHATVGEVEPVTTFNRACGKPECCDKSTSFSHPSGYLRNDHTCCYTDDCTPPIPTLPPVTSERNGVICRGCFSPDSDNCDDTNMSCTGDETQCIQVFTTTSGLISGMSILRGCASKQTCDMGNQYSSSGQVHVIAEVSCSPGSYEI